MQNPNEVDPKSRSTLELIGGEPLAGSGFESELPEPEFTADEPATEGGR
jgi:hypothetical protein